MDEDVLSHKKMAFNMWATITLVGSSAYFGWTVGMMLGWVRSDLRTSRPQLVGALAFLFMWESIATYMLCPLMEDPSSADSEPLVRMHQFVTTQHASFIFLVSYYLGVWGDMSERQHLRLWVGVLLVGLCFGMVCLLGPLDLGWMSFVIWMETAMICPLVASVKLAYYHGSTYRVLYGLPPALLVLLMGHLYTLMSLTLPDQDPMPEYGEPLMRTVNVLVLAFIFFVLRATFPHDCLVKVEPSDAVVTEDSGLLAAQK